MKSTRKQQEPTIARIDLEMENFLILLQEVESRWEAAACDSAALAALEQNLSQRVLHKTAPLQMGKVIRFSLRKS